MIIKFGQYIDEEERSCFQTDKEVNREGWTTKNLAPVSKENHQQENTHSQIRASKTLSLRIANIKITLWKLIVSVGTVVSQKITIFNLVISKYQEAQ